MSQPDDTFSAAADAADGAVDADVEPGASFIRMLRPMAGSEVIEQRLRVGWSQAQLARAIGYSQRQVSHWEHDERSVPQAVSVAILSAVDHQITVDEESARNRYARHRAARMFIRLVGRLSL